MLELGPHEKSLAQQAYQSGEPMPDRIADAPELLLGLQLYLTAFFDLDSERSHALAATPISWSSIMNYAQAFSFDLWQTENLVYFIRQMDSAHLKRIAPPKPSKSSKPRR